MIKRKTEKQGFLNVTNKLLRSAAYLFNVMFLSKNAFRLS